MTRLLVHVEGPTEETFVQEILRPHLIALGYENVGARLLGNARTRAKRGGIKHWGVVREELRRHLLGDGGSIAATMVDYYALPASWPGRTAAVNLPYPNRGPHVHEEVALDFNAYCGLGHRFEPCVLMHEYEGLLFSDCTRFAEGIGMPEIAPQFEAIRNAFNSPEEINDSPMTAPSKRVQSIVPGYQKPLFGVMAALEIGLQTIREECPHFDAWLSRLEGRAV